MINALIFLFLASPSFATITNFDVTGYSRKYDNGTTDLYEVFGGYDTNCASTSTCNTCGTGALVTTSSCNTQAVGPNTELKISFKSDKNVQNYFIITKDVDTANQFKKTTTQVAASQVGTLTVTWNELCAAQDTANANCAADVSNQIFRVGLDVNNDDKLDASDDYKRIRFGNLKQITAAVEKAPVCADDLTAHGICDYAMLRGDQKAYLASYNYTANFPVIAPMTYIAIRMYYASVNTPTDSCTTASYQASNFAEFSLAKSGTSFTANTQGDAAVPGLTNGTTYCFRAAVVDKAGNIRGFTALANIDNIESKATPEEVNGLLDEGNCFIATAAYGNPLNEKIDTFRQFRDEVLLKFSWGKKLVAFYYENSKPLAIEIFKHPWAQTMTRAMLWPLWFVIEVILNYPVFLALTGILLIVSARRRKNAI